MYKMMVIIFLSWTSLILATDYYVDKNAVGGNNGTSWANAWTSFASMRGNFGSMNPGDIVYISGGSTSKTYYEQLTIDNIQGTEASLITFRNGLDAGHNGTVIIDGQNVRLCVQIGYGSQITSYIRIVGLTLQNAVAVGSRGQLSVLLPVNVIYVDSMTTLNNNGFGMFAGGVRGDHTQVDSVFFRWNTILNSTVTPNQADGLMCQFQQNLFVIGNYIRNDNSNQIGHSEPMYAQLIDNYWIEGNKFISTVSTTKQQVFHTMNIKGNSVVFNNLFWGRDQTDRWMTNVYIGENGDLHNSQPDDGVSHTYFYNNTVIGSNNQWFVYIQVDTLDMKNNLFYKSQGTMFDAVSVMLRKEIPMEEIDRNVYTESNIDQLIWVNEPTEHGYDLAELNALGAETGGTPSSRDRVDPLFINTSNYLGDGCGVLVGSPCIDEGVDLGTIIVGGSILNLGVDINGVARPVGEVTIGAYQYVDRGPDITPPEVTGATLLDSVTLVVNFSEALDELTAEDENNYSISNNINIFNASLSGSEVTLQTTTHSPGSYIVTVVNVEDLAGNPIAQSNTSEYSGSSTEVDPINNGLPTEFSLYQNYPNPFNPSTSIQYAVSSEQFVSLKVYDALGSEIATLVNEEKPVGLYEVEFSTIGGSASGGDVYNLPSGIYFYRLQAGSFVETKKMILLK